MGLLQELPFDRLHHAPSPEMRAAGLTPPLCTGPAVPCHAPLTVPQAWCRGRGPATKRLGLPCAGRRSARIAYAKPPR